MPARPAGDDPDLPEFLELLRRDIHLVEEDAPRLLADTSERRIPHGARLLVNFLEHEVLVAALLRHDGIPQDVRHRAVHRTAVEIAQPNAVAGEHGHVAVGEEEHVARVPEDCRYVGGDEVFVIAQSDHHRRTLPRRDDLVRVRARQHRQREYPGQLLDGRPDRGLEIAREVFLYQVRDDFGIGLGDELMTYVLKLLFEREIVLDDAVVDDHDLAGAIAMRMRVLLGGAAVRCPARVADAVAALHGAHANGILQVAQLAGGAAHYEDAVVAHDRQAR